MWIHWLEYCRSFVGKNIKQDKIYVIPDLTSLNENEVSSKVMSNNYSKIHFKLDGNNPGGGIRKIDKILKSLINHSWMPLPQILLSLTTNPKQLSVSFSTIANHPNIKIHTIILQDSSPGDGKSSVSYDIDSKRHPVNLTSVEQLYNGFRKSGQTKYPTIKLAVDGSYMTKFWSKERYSAVLQHVNAIVYKFRVKHILTLNLFEELFMRDTMTEIGFVRSKKRDMDIILKLEMSNDDGYIFVSKASRKIYMNLLIAFSQALGKRHNLHVIIPGAFHLPIVNITTELYPPGNGIILNTHSFKEYGAPFNTPWSPLSIGRAIKTAASVYRKLLVDVPQVSFYYHFIRHSTFQQNYAETSHNNSQEKGGLRLWAEVDTCHANDHIESPGVYANQVETLIFSVNKLASYLEWNHINEKTEAAERTEFSSWDSLEAYQELKKSPPGLTKDLNELKRSLQALNVTFGCSLEINNGNLNSLSLGFNQADAFDNSIEERFRRILMDGCDVILWQHSFSNRAPQLGKLANYVFSILPDLLKLAKVSSEISKLNPKAMQAMSIAWIWRHSEVEQPCFNDTLKYPDFLDIMRSFAKLNNFLLFEGNAFSVSTPAHFAFGRWNPLSRRTLGESENYTDGLNEPCIKWNPGQITKPIEFSNLTLAGIMMDRKYSDEDSFVTGVRFVLDKFRAMEIHSLEKLQKFLRLVNNIPEVQRNIVNIFLSLADEEIVKDYIFETLNTTLPKLKAKNTLVALGGVHFRNISNIAEITALQIKLQMQEIFKSSNVSLGLVLDENTCGDLINNSKNQYYQLKVEKVHFIGNVSYIICEIDFDYSNSSQSLALDYTTLYYTFRKFLFLRWTIHKVFPDLHVMVKLSWPSGITSSEIEQFLRFWNFVEDFARANNFMYFIKQAFDIGNDTRGWWRRVEEKAADPLFYTEKEAEFLGNPTRIPTNEEKSNVSKVLNLLWLGLAVIAVIVVLCIIIVVLWLQWRNAKVIISRKEVREILEGKGTWKENRAQMQISMEGVVLKYHQKFELHKQDICIDSSKILGVGEFGTVFKCQVNDTKAAAKVPKTKCKEVLRSVLLEIKAMSYLWSGEHENGRENVLRFIGAFTGEAESGTIIVVTEKCDNGSLQEYLRSNENSIPQYNLFHFAYEISNGMDFISRKKVVHGDLSSRNVLLDEHNICKISDFGLSRKLYMLNIYIKKNEEPLPWRWMAPESLTLHEFSEKSDVWSFGVTAWEIFSCGKIPYAGVSWSTDFAESLTSGLRLRLHKPEYANNEVYKIMMACWADKPSERPCFKDLREKFSNQRSNEYLAI